MQIEKLVEQQRSFFSTHTTLPTAFRISMLKKLRTAIQKHETDINDALFSDLGKSEMESYMCEVGLTLSELTYQINHIRKWNRPKKHRTLLANFHAKSFSMREPYGIVLVMSPWNYPFMLCMEPLIGALAAGNCCVVKPSAYSPATSAIIKKIVEEVFPPEYVTVIVGGRQENQTLLEQRFDYIFFTGGVNVGKLVMEKASSHLTPVTLELGGKSPCIVTQNCDLKIAATRIVFGKFLNCGQTCVAPDYCLVDRNVKDDFMNEIIRQIQTMFGENPLKNNSYGKIINPKHFQRLLGLIDTNKVAYGGKYDTFACKIEPTVLSKITLDDAIMQEEIFGPLLPIITYDSLEEAESFIHHFEKPLALYLFTKDKHIEKRFLQNISFGGGCINDTVVHLATSEMSFGGVGYSGMGSYHGLKSFETFTHEKSILKKYCWIDLPMRYQPYKAFHNKLIHFFLH